MSKTFAQAPKPKPLPADLAAFERGGPGQDTRNRIPSNVAMGKPSNVEMREHSSVVRVEPSETGNSEVPKAEKPEPTRRLSIDLPQSLHRRFKTACSKTDRKMLAEVMEFIKRRTAELEKE
jgi:hypothetical protein